MKRFLLAACLLWAATARAQGVLYSSVAQAISSIPGSAQGVSNVFVPIPNATITICTGTYSGSPCLTQTASIYQDQAMTIPITPYDVADAYGNFQFWAPSGTYYGTIVGTVAGATVQNNFQFQLPTVGTPGVASINTVPGAFTFTGNGVSCTGTTCTFIAALASYYQTMQANGTAEPQRANLNFSQRFELSDASANNQTNVDANASGNGLYLLTMAGAPGTSTALAQFDGSGNATPLPTPSQCASAGQMVGIAANGNANCQTKDEWSTFSGCSFPNDGANLTCINTVTLPVALLDTNYTVSCVEYTNPAVGSVILGNISYSIVSTTSYTVAEMTQGSSAIWPNYGNYGKSYVCHAHHN